MKQLKAYVIVDKIVSVSLVSSRSDYTVQKRTKNRIFGKNLTGWGHDYETLEEYLTRFNNDPEFREFIQNDDTLIIKYKPKVSVTTHYSDGIEIKKLNFVSFFNNMKLAEEYLEKVNKTQIDINTTVGRCLIEVESMNDIINIRKI